MSGIRVNEWLHNSGTGGIWQSSAGNVGIASSVPTAKLVVTGDANISGITTAETFVQTVGQLSNRNLMINGAMNVAQYGTSDTSDAQGRTTVDRWSVVWSGLEEEISRYQESLSSSDTGPWEKGFRKAWKIQNGNQTGGADASGYINPQYTIEAQDLASSGWNPADPTSKLTLSFWVKSSVAQTFYSYLYVEDGGGDSYSFSYALSANTWTKVTKTIPGHADLAVNSDNGGGMTIYLPLFLGTDRTTSGHTLNQWQSWSGSNRTPDQTTTWYTTNDATWHMTGIQLEVGSVATPFEHRSYGEELSRCQRYFYSILNSGWVARGENGAYVSMGCYFGDAKMSAFLYHPVPMRANPTIVIGTGTNYWGIYRAGAEDTFDSLGSIITSTAAPFGNRFQVLEIQSGVSGTGGHTGVVSAKDTAAYLQFTAEY